MTKIKNCAVIVSDFPDDAVETDDEIVVFPGRNLSEAFCEILNGLGYATTEPEHEHEHGWTFEATSEDGCRTWFQITVIGDECLVITEDQGRRRYSDPTTSAYFALLSKFGEALHANPRFKSVRWSTLDNIDIGEEPRPGFSLLEGGPVEGGDASDASGGSRTADGALRTCAQIVADLTGCDDEDSKDPIGVGLRIALSFCRILDGLGYETTAPLHNEARGWTFTATAKDGYRAGFQLVHRGGHLLLTQNWGRGRGLFHMFSARKRAEADAASYVDLLTKFAGALERYPRFTSIRWCTEAELAG